MISRDKVKKIVENNPYYFSTRLKEEYNDFYQWVDKTFEGDKISEKLYRYVYGEEKAVCNLNSCDNEVEFLGFSRGFRDFCSRSCTAKKEESREKRDCEFCGDEFETYKCEDKVYCSHDCYIEHRLEKKDFDEQLKKAREKCRKRYGSMGYGSKEIRGNIYKTMVDRYDNKYYNNREKMKKTKKERHGDPNYVNHKKAKKTKLERYGNEGYNNTDKSSLKIKRKKFEELKDNERFEGIEPLFSFQEYEGVKNYKMYDFKCKKCGEEFEDYLKKNNVPRCPNCYDGWNKVGRSETEKEIYKYVKSIVPDDVEVVDNDKSLLDGKELDIYIPEKNVAIEFNGLYWHSEASGEKDKFYHQEKTEECEEKDVHLIHIFEHEWRDKRDIVKNRLKHILGCSDEETIYARECSVSEISRERKTKFLEKYHIQGAGRSSVKLGLFHGEFFNSDLKAVMTFGTPSVAQGHKGDKNNFWEMKRFALSQRVVGAAGKLFKHFIRNYDVEKVITYADRRWSTKLSNVYEKIGFEYVGYSDPNYFYFHTEEETPQLQHRFGFRKNVLDEKLEDFDPNLTEWENMQRHGYDRIWDSGNLKYVWER